MSAKNTGPRNGRRIPVKVTAAERGQIEATARAVGLPVSTYLRQAGLAYRPASIADSDALMALIKVKGDLSRLLSAVKDTPGAINVLPRSRSLIAEMGKLILSYDTAIKKVR